MRGDQPLNSAPDALPEVITRYLKAHRAHEAAICRTRNGGLLNR
jgi:hypothetical protein